MYMPDGVTPAAYIIANNAINIQSNLSMYTDELGELNKSIITLKEIRVISDRVNNPKNVPALGFKNLV